jgi:hypothetical protein
MYININLIICNAYPLICRMHIIVLMGKFLINTIKISCAIPQIGGYALQIWKSLCIVVDLNLMDLRKCNTADWIFIGRKMAEITVAIILLNIIILGIFRPFGSQVIVINCDHLMQNLIIYKHVKHVIYHFILLLFDQLLFYYFF